MPEAEKNPLAELEREAPVEQVEPACSTVMVEPATVSVAVRLAALGLARAKKRTSPAPVRLRAALVSSQGAEEVTAHEQADGARTWKVAEPPVGEGKTRGWRGDT